jgi:hypothetical protein
MLLALNSSARPPDLYLVNVVGKVPRLHSAAQQRSVNISAIGAKAKKVRNIASTHILQRSVASEGKTRSHAL